MKFRKSIIAIAKVPISIFIFIIATLLYLSSFDVISDFKIILVILSLVFIGTAIHSIVLWMGSWLSVQNERVSFRQQDGIFKFDIVEIPFNRITAVSASKHGLGSYVLNYGDIKINAGGQETSYHLKKFVDPIKVKQIIEEKLIHK